MSNQLLQIFSTTMMKMPNSSLEDLFFDAAETEDSAVIEGLFDLLTQQPDLSSEEISSGIEFIMEAWGASVAASQAKSDFCLRLALLSPPDSEAFRIALQHAFIRLRKSGFLKSEMLRITGIRDTTRSLKEAAERFTVLENIHSGVQVFSPETGRIGEVEQTDEITSEIRVRWHNSTSGLNLPLQTAVDGLVFMRAMPTLPVSSDRSFTESPEAWMDKIYGDFISPCSQSALRQLAGALALEAGISVSVLDEWLEGKSTETVSSAGRHP